MADSNMKFHWRCQCGTLVYYLLPECTKCKKSGGTRMLSRTQNAGEVLDWKVQRGFTFAQAVRQDKLVPQKSKRKLDTILSQPKATKRQKVKALLKDEEAMHAAEFNLVSGYFSGNTIKSYCSEIAFYEEVCHASGIKAWPVSDRSLERFGAVLKASGYRAARMFFSAIATTSVAMGCPLNDDLKAKIVWIKRSCERDLGEEKWKEPITLQHFKAMNGLPRMRGRNMKFRRLVMRLMLVCWFCLLRPQEVLTLRGWCACKTKLCTCGADVRVRKDEVTIVIRGDKTHQGGEGRRRLLQCICGGKECSAVVPMCPVCLVRALRRDSDLGVNNELWWMSQGVKDKPLAKTGFREELNNIMEVIGEKLLDDQGELRFGGQSMRRGGVQQMAAQGVPIYLMKIWGRWDSWTIERYVREIPLQTINVARVMLKGSFDGSNLAVGEMAPGQMVLVARGLDVATWYRGQIVEVRLRTVVVRLIAEPHDIIEVSKSKAVRV